ncbi:hypothetical protein JCM10295v2_001213 [Rhodotorula toruloides]
MLAWLLKLLIFSLNMRSSSKALTPARSSGQTRSRAKDGSRRSERARKKQIREELTNVVVWVCFCLLERLADRTLGWLVPLYGTFKIFALLLILVWRGPGSQQLFEKVISPLIRPYERPLDFVGFVLSESIDLAFFLLLFVPRKVAQRWRRRKDSPDVPAILRGLRHPRQPRLAQSLADSIEKSQGDSDAISARFSQPVQVRLNPVPFRPQRPATASQRSSAQVLPRQLTDQPLPPVASSAPFRRVPIIPSTAEPAVPKPLYRPPPVASTSHLPVPQPTRRISSAKADSASVQEESLYPSLASLSAPLEQPKVPSSVPSQPAPEPRPPSMPANRASTKGKGKAKLREEAEVDTGRTSPRTTRALTSRRSSPPPSALTAPEVRLDAAEEMDVDSPERSATPPHPPTSTSTLPPPTPALPGAFSFRSPAQIPLPDSPAVRIPATDKSDSDQATPRRHSARTSTLVSTSTSSAKGKKRARETSATRSSEAWADEAVTPKRKVARVRDADAGDASVASKVKNRHRAVENAVTTPRQRALGAIAQLSKDLFDDGEKGGLGFGTKAKKKGTTGILGKGKAGGAGGSKLRQSTRRRTEAEDDEDYAEEDEQPAGPSRSTTYCTAKHQKRDWPWHKAACWAKKTGEPFIVHLGLARETTDGAPWCKPFLDSITIRYWRTYSLVGST